MLYEYMRLFTYDGTSLMDLSLENQDETATITFDLSATKYIYIAQYYPFNNFFAHVGTANAALGTLALEYWDGRDWHPAVDVLDGTKSAGAPFARSGVVQFSPDRKQSWNYINDTSESRAPTELNGINVYDCYWLRVSCSTIIPVALKELSYAFTTTERLNNLDVEIDNFYAAFAVGKADWIQEILTCSKLVLADLKRLGLVVHQGQILRFDDVSLACDHKALDLIYTNLGASYNEKRMDIRQRYSETLNSRRFTFDDNNDALVSKSEINSRIKVMDR